MPLRSRLLLVVLAGALAGCTVVQVENLSESTARVMISLPDSTGVTSRVLAADEAFETFSGHGGRVEIRVGEDERYRLLLGQIRDSISERLFTEGDSLTPDEIATLVQRLREIEDAVARSLENAAECTVAAPDESVVHGIITTDLDGDYTLSCSVQRTEW